MHGVNTDIENQANGTLTRPRTRRFTLVGTLSPPSALWCDISAAGGRKPRASAVARRSQSDSVRDTYASRCPRFLSSFQKQSCYGFRIPAALILDARGSAPVQRIRYRIDVGNRTCCSQHGDVPVDRCCVLAVPERCRLPSLDRAGAEAGRADTSDSAISGTGRSTIC